MPCTLPLVGGGSPDKAAALARLLPSCLAGAALLCLLLLASRRTVVDSGLVSAVAQGFPALKPKSAVALSLVPSVLCGTVPPTRSPRQTI